MSPPRDRFATTHWSLVLAAARDEDLDGCRALETLCQQYWYPLYVFVRRRGYTSEDAGHLTQAFFTRLLAKGEVARATPTTRPLPLVPADGPPELSDQRMGSRADRLARRRSRPQRRRFGDILRTEIAQTVDPGEVDDEIQFLIAAVGHPGVKL